MRVLALHPFGWTGEYPMLIELQRRGLEVCVFEEKRDIAKGKRTLSDHFVNQGDAIRTLWYRPSRGAERILTWLPDRIFRQAFDGRNLVHRMWVIRDAVQRFKPDVIYCTDGFSYAVPAALLKATGLLDVPLVVSYIGGDILDCSHMDYGRRRTRLVNWLIRTSVVHIESMRPLCDSLARTLIKDGANPKRIKIVPIQIGVAPEIYEGVYANKPEMRSRVRQRLGIPANARLIMTLAGNYRSKGIQDVAAAWAGILDAYPDAYWLLCGPEHPWLAEGVFPRLSRAADRKRIIVTGILRGADTYEHLAAADLHVNPTLCEGLNMATVDAATVATPTVTSDAAGIADWVKRYDCGLVYSAGEVCDLQRAVIVALRDESRLSRLGQNCRRMMAEFTSDVIGSQLEQLLRDVA